MLAPLTRTTLLIAVLALAGCSSARKTDVLEARLRSQEDMLAVYESEVTRVKIELSNTRREAEDLRLSLAEAGQTVVPAEESGAIFRAAGIEFSSLMTGGADIDGQAGHDGLTVVLVPHDQSGELVKLPGNIEIEAFDLSLPGGAQRIGHWTFDQREVHEYWHNGVIQSGYQFKLPWQTLPKSDQILVHGHLSTANGRKFDTTLTVKIDPPSGDINAPTVDGIQQAAADDENPFAIQQAAAEHSADERPDAGIIWADGEGPATDRRPATNRPDEGGIFFNDSPRPPAETPDLSPFGKGQSTTTRRPGHASTMTGSSPPLPQRVPRPQPLTEQQREAAREVPPPIEDWWSDDDWATLPADNGPPGIMTSDSFTDETIPRYR